MSGGSNSVASSEPSTRRPESQHRLAADAQPAISRPKHRQKRTGPKSGPLGGRNGELLRAVFIISGHGRPRKSFLDPFVDP